MLKDTISHLWMLRESRESVALVCFLQGIPMLQTQKCPKYSLFPWYGTISKIWLIFLHILHPARLEKQKSHITFTWAGWPFRVWPLWSNFHYLHPWPSCDNHPARSLSLPPPPSLWTFSYTPLPVFHMPFPLISWISHVIRNKVVLCTIWESTLTHLCCCPKVPWTPWEQAVTTSLSLSSHPKPQCRDSLLCLLLPAVPGTHSKPG